MADLLQNPNDKIDADPAELTPLLTKVMTSGLAKRLAEHYKKPWTAKLEEELQQGISALVAECQARKINHIKVVVTRPNGQKVMTLLDVAKISKERKLQ